MLTTGDSTSKQGLYCPFLDSSFPAMGAWEGDWASTDCSLGGLTLTEPFTWQIPSGTPTPSRRIPICQLDG